MKSGMSSIILFVSMSVIFDTMTILSKVFMIYGCDDCTFDNAVSDARVIGSVSTRIVICSDYRSTLY